LLIRCISTSFWRLCGAACRDKGKPHAGHEAQKLAQLAARVNASVKRARFSARRDLPFPERLC